MKSNLRKPVLNGHQFTGLLLLLFSSLTLIVRFYPVDTDTSWRAVSAKLESEALMVQTYGFILPPLQSLLLPLLTVDVFLALVFACLRKSYKIHESSNID
jgi:hypothetical protein